MTRFNVTNHATVGVQQFGDDNVANVGGDYLSGIGTRVGFNGPQTQRSNEREIQNSAGGFVYGVTDQQRLERFIVLGSEGGTFYVNQHALTRENARNVEKMIEADGLNVVRTVVTISREGRAPRQSEGLFVLAMCASLGDVATRKAALDALPPVCRTAKTLMQFVGYAKQFRGWGRALRGAVARWYEQMPADKLAYQVVKYQIGHGTTNRKLLGLSHATTSEPEREQIFRWARAMPFNLIDGSHALQVIRDFEAMKKATGDARLPLAARLPHDCIPKAWKKEAEIWERLLLSMPLTAMIRNLGTMTAVGLLTPHSGSTAVVVGRLKDGEYLRRSRVHPMALCIAQAIYAEGKGLKGSQTWIPVPEIVAALEEGFYAAFGNVQIAGKRTLVALDYSGSMRGEATSVGLSAWQAALAMALVQVQTEPHCKMIAFSENSDLIPVAKGHRRADVQDYVERLQCAGTDCALPMLWALGYRGTNSPWRGSAKGLRQSGAVDLVDTFVVYTDNETWQGEVKAVDALRHYRRITGIPAKLVVCGMTSTRFTIADPTDAGMLDCAGLDAALPRIIADFSRGAPTERVGDDEAEDEAA